MELIAEENKIDKLKKWYNDNENILDRMSDKLNKLMEEILQVEKIPYSSIMSRKKDLKSLCIKADKPKYVNPIEEIKDFVGIRIVAYVESDLKKICDIVKQNFEIDIKNSVDKSRDLGTNKVGYRSVHYIAKLSKARLNLPEYRLFEEFCFEIQVRTLLQHTWAEIEHDRNYKFSGALPDEIKRKFSLIAGTLELLDNQFDSIANEMDEYTKNVSEKTKSGNIEDILIDGTSLKEYLLNRFASKIGKGITAIFGPEDAEEEVIVKELYNFDIKTLQDLQNLISKHEDKDIYEDDENFLSILRTYMLVEDANKYFNQSWNEDWKAIYSMCVQKITKYNNELPLILEKYDITLI